MTIFSVQTITHNNCSKVTTRGATAQGWRYSGWKVKRRRTVVAPLDIPQTSTNTGSTELRHDELNSKVRNSRTPQISIGQRRMLINTSNHRSQYVKVKHFMHRVTPHLTHTYVCIAMQSTWPAATVVGPNCRPGQKITRNNLTIERTSPVPYILSAVFLFHYQLHLYP
jgi:hypothetical protein